MLRLESLNDFEWRRLVERLDKAVAAAARDYLRHLYVKRVPIRVDTWEEDLEELSSRENRTTTGLGFH